MKISITTCDKCGAEINPLDRFAALLQINSRSGDTPFGRAVNFDLCAACLPLLGAFLGVTKGGE